MRTIRSPRPAPAESAVQALAARLREMFELRECRYEPFPYDAQLPRIEPGRIRLPAAEPGVARWQPGDGVELPVEADGLTLGRFVLVPPAHGSGVALSPRGRDDAIGLARRLAPLIAAAIDADERAGRRLLTVAPAAPACRAQVKMIWPPAARS
jgi:hypothetical protein